VELNYKPLRHPKAPGLSLAGFQLVVALTNALRTSKGLRRRSSTGKNRVIAAVRNRCVEQKADICQNAQQPSCQNERATSVQVPEILGAGEGNRTLVISLEGSRKSSVFSARVDKFSVRTDPDAIWQFAAVHPLEPTTFAEQPIYGLDDSADRHSRRHSSAPLTITRPPFSRRRQ
jgi:hypothetical protein